MVIDVLGLLSGDVRARSKALLRLVKKPNSIPTPLIGYVVKHDPSDEVACVAAFLLRFAGKRRARETVIELLRSELAPERLYSVLNSVRYWKEPSIIPALVRLSDSPAYPIRLLALLLLAKYGEQRQYVMTRLMSFRESISNSPPFTQAAHAFCPAPVFRSTDEAVRLAETKLEQLLKARH